MSVSLTINGAPTTLALPEETPLLMALRNDCELNGPKYGCGLGECGACAVLIEGRVARACVLRLGDVEGRAVTTLEGLAADGRLASGAGRLRRDGGRAMRLLPERHDRNNCRLPRREPRSRRGANPRRVALQSLPLRRASGNPGRRAPCRAKAARVSDLQPRGLTRTSVLARPGVLAVVRGSDSADPERLEPFVVVGADGAVLAFNGHVDLGTGIRTALAQIVAEELDVAFARVTMILGDTALTPDQGPTIASETIQITAVPLRRAAAQARRELVARAAHRLGVEAGALVVDEGVVRFRRGRNLLWRVGGQFDDMVDARRDGADQTCGAASVGRHVDPARRSAGEGGGVAGLCSRSARGRHAAWPRGAPALCGRGCGAVRRTQSDRRRSRVGGAYSGP